VTMDRSAGPTQNLCEVGLSKNVATIVALESRVSGLGAVKSGAERIARDSKI
jgi:hypothetical protein